MRRSTRLTAAMGGGAALGIVALGLSYTTYLLKVDPYRTMRGDSADPEIGVELNGVRLRHYQDGKLIVSADIDRVTIRRDRQELGLEGIRDGVYHGRRGDFGFEAKLAQWTSGRQAIEVLAGAHIFNKRLDLRAEQFEFDAPDSSLYIPGRVEGRVFDGDVVGSKLLVDLGHDSYSAHIESWQGTVPQDQGQVASDRKKWKSLKPSDVSGHGDITTIVKPEITDGDVIVEADEAQINNKTHVMVATGNVMYFSSKANLHCEKVVVYDDEKRAVLTGAVRMLIKAKESEKLAVEEIPPYRPVVPEDISKDRPPAPVNTTPIDPGLDQKAADEEVHQGKTLRKYPSLVYADQVEYWYRKGERHAIVTGHPQAHQELSGGRWRQVWGTTGYYDGEAETLRVVGTDGKRDVRLKTSLEDDAVCDSFEMSTKEDDDDFHAIGLVSDFTVNKDDVPETTKTGGGKTGGGTSGGGGKTTGGGH